MSPFLKYKYWRTVKIRNSFEAPSLEGFFFFSFPLMYRASGVNVKQHIFWKVKRQVTLKEPWPGLWRMYKMKHIIVEGGGLVPQKLFPRQAAFVLQSGEVTPLVTLCFKMIRKLQFPRNMRWFLTFLTKGLRMKWHL